MVYNSTQKFFGAEALQTFLELVKSSVKKTNKVGEMGQDVVSRAMLDYIPRFLLAEGIEPNYPLVKLMMEKLEKCTLSREKDVFGLTDVTKVELAAHLVELTSHKVVGKDATEFVESR